MISVPPVEPLFRKQIPKKQPQNKPPMTTAIKGSVSKGTVAIGTTLNHMVNHNTPQTVRKAYRQPMVKAAIISSNTLMAALLNQIGT